MDNLFISTRLGGALKILITCLYRTVLGGNYLFHTESAEIIYFKNISAPPWILNGGSLIGCSLPLMDHSVGVFILFSFLVLSAECRLHNIYSSIRLYYHFC